MRIKNINRILTGISFTVMLVVLGIFFYWHLRLGLVRFFDADEFAHLHWGYSLSIGERPYTDFFYLFPPFFLYPMAAIFKIFGRTTMAVLNARMFIFIIFAATNGILFLLARKVRNIHFALLTLIFFAFLPLPFDKMIEIRPDLIATCLSLAGMYLFIKGEEGDKGDGGDKGKQKKYFFLSGLFYAASLGFVPKTIFFLVPVVIVFLISKLSNLRRDERKSPLYFFLGMIPVGLVLLLVIASFGNIPLSVYSMTRMATEITRTLGAKFYMRPDLFFYPNETYYGISGWSPALIVNLIIYVSASIWAIHRLLSVGSSTSGESLRNTPEVFSSRVVYGGDTCVREFLIAGSLFANLAAFVYFYPLKHAQYLIPVAPFLAFYFADLLFRVIPTPSIVEGEGSSDPPAGGERKVRLARFLTPIKSGLEMTFGTAILLAILLFITVVGFQMNEKKMQWVNKPALDNMNKFLSIIPANAPVYDLSGETIFFPNGYYFCCLPYGQYEESLYFTIPDIAKETEAKKTNYVYLGWTARLNEIPVPHAKYITDNFVPITPDKILLKRKIN